MAGLAPSPMAVVLRLAERHQRKVWAEVLAGLKKLAGAHLKGLCQMLGGQASPQVVCGAFRPNPVLMSEILRRESERGFLFCRAPAVMKPERSK